MSDLVAGFIFDSWSRGKTTGLLKSSHANTALILSPLTNFICLSDIFFSHQQQCEIGSSICAWCSVVSRRSWKEIMSLLILSKSAHYSHLALSVLRLHYPWCLLLRLNEADLHGSFGNVCSEKCECGQPVVLGQMGSSSSTWHFLCHVSSCCLLSLLSFPLKSLIHISRSLDIHTLPSLPPSPSVCQVHWDESQFRVFAHQGLWSLSVLEVVTQ